MKYSALKILGLVVGGLVTVIFVALLLTSFGLKNLVQGNTLIGIRLLNLSKPVSWTTSRLTGRTSQSIETWHAINTFLTSRGKFLVLFQNSDEIRATGGFIGSYTVLDLASSEPLRLEILDMYDPSGISQSLPSPPGQAEYLSEGKGMKLVDANWNPDFPSSAELILSYFAAIANDSQSYDGVIAIPLNLVEQFLSAVGGVYIVDEQQTVSGDSLAELVRRDRDQFFAGSKQKTQSLQSVYTALKLKFSLLNTSDWRRLVQNLNSIDFLKSIQLFAREPRLQANLRSAGLAGELLPYRANDLYLFPVESNVGINKANRKVTRHLTAAVVDQQLTATTKFTNSYTSAERPIITPNTAYTVAPHLAYVNYYRVLTRPDMMVQNVTINGEPSAWDETELISANKLTYRQIGFLVVVPEESEVWVEVKFALPQLDRPQLIIQRQVGLNYTSITDSIE